MIYIVSKYFNVNRILLLAIGLWPYHQSKFARFQVILFLGILTSVIVFQVKVLLEQLQNIFNELRDEKEIAIIENYWSKAKHYTTRVTTFGTFSLFIIALQPVWRISGIFLFVNESRSDSTIQLITEYFVDEEKHFYLIWLHTNVAFCIGSIVLVSTGTMLVTCIKHACGMFSVASYRIEQAMEIPQNIGFRNEIIICKHIIDAVHIHRKAIEFSRLIISNFEKTFLFLVALCVICLSLNLFRISQVVSFGGDLKEAVLHFVLVTAVFIYLFLANYAAQEVMDHNNQVFVTAYNVQWYIAPLHIQRMILFLLQRSTKAVNINLGGLFVASLETFCTMISASVSYFTVLHSTQ